MSLVPLLTELETILEAQGLSISKEVFNFEKVPDSVINNKYRYEVVAMDDTEESSGGMDANAQIEVFIAYNINQGLFTKDLQRAKVTVSETIRRAIYVGICGYSILTGVRFIETVNKMVIMNLTILINDYSWSIE